MRGAVDALAVRPDFVLIDGNRIKGFDDFTYQTIVRRRRFITVDCGGVRSGEGEPGPLHASDGGAVSAL